MEIEKEKKKKKGRPSSERKPFSDRTNFITPPPGSRANPLCATSRKPRFERSSVGSNSNGSNEIQAVREADPLPPDLSSSSFGSPALCASGTDQNERLYKRRRLDPEKRMPSMGSMSCPPVGIKTGKPWNDNNETASKPGPTQVWISVSSTLNQKDLEVKGTSSSKHGRSRMFRSMSTCRRPKKQRHSMPEITVRSALPEDYIEEQNAHFAEIDAFELQEEVVSSDEQD